MGCRAMLTVDNLVFAFKLRIQRRCELASKRFDFARVSAEDIAHTSELRVVCAVGQENGDLEPLNLDMLEFWRANEKKKGQLQTAPAAYL